MSRASDAAREMAEARWKGTSATERRELMSAAAKAFWEKMTPEERTEFARRRRLGGKKKNAPRAKKTKRRS